MNKKLAALLVAVIVVAGLYFVHRHRAGSKLSATPAPRQLAPDFTLTQLSGQPLTLSAYRGKVVLLDFWATWCDPCRKETPQFVDLQNRYRDQDLQVIGVSMDDTAPPVHDFYQQFHMNYPVVMGNAKIGELYGGVLGLPIALLIDRQGRIYAKHMGATEVSVLEKEIRTLLHSN